MSLSLKESNACTEMAKLMYDFLPGSGARSWKGHVNFGTVAREVGVGHFWQGGSKEPAIARLLELTLEHSRDRFAELILTVVREGIKYRSKNNNPIQRKEVETLNGLILEVKFKFPDLWDEGFLNSLDAPSAVRAQQHVEQALREEQLKATKRSEKAEKLENMCERFYALDAQENRQAAGYALEKLLNELFELSGLEPREPFRVTGEQIDGSFCLDSEIYLVEAKWRKGPVPESDLLVFRSKISGKSSFTRGVFVSIYGFTNEAKTAITQGKQPNFFAMDGDDLSLVLSGQIALGELLRAKQRALAEQGQVFFSARSFLH